MEQSRDARIARLAADIRYHQDLYYNAEPEITDPEFDAMWDELKRLDPQNAVFADVGRDVSGGFPKREHIIPMMSQDKAANPEQFLKWAAKVGHEHYIVQYKLDGASLELQYEKGRFLHGVTRGDGRVGDDITANVSRMKGLVPQIDESFTGGIRGEVIMTHAVHKEHFPEKANCRNAANGLMKRKDGQGSEHLDVVCYDAVHQDDPQYFSDEQAKLEWLQQQGLVVVETRVFESPADVVAYREDVSARRHELAYDIDGLVVKGLRIDAMDARRARPELQIAYKFALEEAETILEEVEWSPSGHHYTPVGVVRPVKLAGTTVKRANLVHPNHILELGLRLGSRVIITKRGEIIPKIEQVLENPPDAEAIRVPETCESCGTGLINEGTRVICPNRSCSLRILHRLRRWIEVLDVRDFGPVMIEKLHAAGHLMRLGDFYRLQAEHIASLEGMGMGIAQKALGNLHAVREVSLAQFVAGLDIENIGETTIETIAHAGFNTLDALQAAGSEQLSAIHGIGEVTAATIVTGLAELSAEIEDLISTSGIEIAAPPSGDLPLSGVSFCFTGTLTTMKRSEAAKLVASLGGEAKSSVTRDLGYLVTSDPESTSGKARKARDLGVKVVDEASFRRIAGLDQ